MLAALLCAGLAAALGGDVLVLTDGEIVAGRPLARATGGVEVTFPSGKVFVPDALLEFVRIEGEPDPEPRDDTERAQYAKGLVPYGGQWILRKRRDALVAKRVAAAQTELADNLAHREWKDRRTFETKNFRIEYTVPQRVLEDYAARLEAYFQIFAKDWKIHPPRSGKLPVCFYSSAKEFHRTGGMPQGVLAYFKNSGGYELDAYFERLDPGYTEQVLFHEANHYLQQLIDEEFRYPHWPGEALAEYYGAAHWEPDKKELTVGLLQEGRLAQIQDDIARGEPYALKKLLTEGAFEDYTWGWSLVYFLMNDARYREPFKKFTVALAKAPDVRRTNYGGEGTVEPQAMVEAFERYLGLKTPKEFTALEVAWHDYVQEELLANPTLRGIEKGALAALHTERKLRAKRLFEEAVARGSTNAFVYHQYATLLRDEDREKALELWHKAVELAPLTGGYWFALGRALEGGDAAEATRLKALAHEIDPELEEDSFE
jgi:tetratricopeptide (TPR) repeat protein